MLRCGLIDWCLHFIDFTENIGFLQKKIIHLQNYLGIRLGTSLFYQHCVSNKSLGGLLRSFDFRYKTVPTLM